MHDFYIEDKNFTGADFSQTPFEKAAYEGCSFTNCDFSGINLSGFHFADCSFNASNLSNALMGMTALQNVRFSNCKLLGLHFDHCDPFLFEVAFENCTLNLSSFYKVKLKKTRFKDCSMQEVDLAEADLSNAILDNCDLAGAIFSATNLEKADLRTAYNYSIHPEENKIKKARFSLPGLTGLLDRYGIEIS